MVITIYEINNQKLTYPKLVKKYPNFSSLIDQNNGYRQIKDVVSHYTLLDFISYIVVNLSTNNIFGIINYKKDSY
jgi:hypothetical protein